jgi:membrane peptidoglycan carboxypeptidase
MPEKEKMINKADKQKQKRLEKKLEPTISDSKKSKAPKNVLPDEGKIVRKSGKPTLLENPLEAAMILPVKEKVITKSSKQKRPEKLPEKWPAPAATDSKKWKAPNSFSLAILTLPFRIIYNMTRNQNFFIRWSMRFSLLGALFLAFCIGLFCLIYIPRAQLFDISQVAKMPGRSLVYASDGKTELGRLHGDNRYVVKYEQVSQNFIMALLAQEDAKFYKHFGVDFIGAMRIPWIYYKFKKLSGASTLTMQLARNTYPLGEGFDRKLMEVALAFRVEANYEKNEILEHYTNRIFFGHSMYGVEAASRAYFEKAAADLTLSEAAMLAGMIRGPNFFSPFKSIEDAEKERNRALDRMVSAGFISQAVAEETKQEKLDITPQDRRTIQDTYVMNYVDKELDLILEKHKIKMGNLKVYTTIDHRLQELAEQHLEEHLSSIERTRGYQHQTRSAWQAIPKSQQNAPDYLQGALVCIENKSGEILTVVGGRSAKESALNRATEDPYKRKQIGSIVKPFVYLSAYDKGLTGQIRDTPIRGWPDNFDGKYYRSVSVDQAIEESRNCAAVHAGLFATKEGVAESLRFCGFKSYNVNDSSFFLGAGCATPWEVASAFTIFPNYGNRYSPFIIREIRDQNDKEIWSSEYFVYQAAKRSSTTNVKRGLEKVTKTGTARVLQGSLNFREPCGGKTGTSNEGKDAWFAGYTESITCAVWVGLDNPKPIIEDGTGGKLALPIWAKLMNSAKELGYPMVPRAIPIR